MLSDKIDKIQKLIIKLSATKELSDCHIKSNYFLYLWKKQFVGSKEAELLYPPSTFGINFTYYKHLTMNGYLLAL